MKQKTSLWVPYFFLSPFLICFGVFTFYPLLSSIALSLQQTYGPGTARFIFLDNYKNLFADPLFWTAVRNNFYYTAGSLFIQLPCSLLLALALNHPKIRGKAAFRLIYYAPSLVGMVFVGVIFGLLFEKRTGLINQTLHRLCGFPIDFAWLQEYTMPALILASFWMYVGFNMIYFLAALQNVNQETLEAATIDGANAWQRFLHVTIPSIKPVAGFVVLLSVVGSFQLFELPWILLSGPGIQNRGLTVVMYLYQNGFELGDLGYASAIGWVLALVLIGLTVVQRLLMKDESK